MAYRLIGNYHDRESNGFPYRVGTKNDNNDMAKPNNQKPPACCSPLVKVCWSDSGFPEENKTVFFSKCKWVGETDFHTHYILSYAYQF